MTALMRDLPFGRDNGTFGYGHVLFYPSLTEFIAEAGKEVQRVKNTSDLTRTTAQNIIRFSSLPWVDFTSISHARMFSTTDSLPQYFLRQNDAERWEKIHVDVYSCASCPGGWLACRAIYRLFSGIDE